MKKVILIGITVCMLVVLTACGEDANKVSDTIIDMNDNVSEAEDVLGDYKETMDNIDAIGEDVLEDY